MRSSSPKTTNGNLGPQLADLEIMGLESLRSEWLRLYRSAAPPRLSRDLLARGIAYRLQETTLGGLTATTKRKLAKLADGTDVAADSRSGAAIRPKPGATLVRTWRGQTHTVQILADGYEHQGQRYRSLSHIAQAITGAHWSGPRFFGLNQSAAAAAEATPRDSPNAQAA
jgi:hypothetical protein